MTIGELLRACVETAKIQMLHECLLGSRLVNGRGSQGKRKKHEPYTCVEFATVAMTPNDAMWWTGARGRLDSGKPEYVGIIVWVPTAFYESATTEDAVKVRAAALTEGDRPSQVWQAIETAPKDGSVVLAYAPGGTFANGQSWPPCVGTAYFVSRDPLNGEHWVGPLTPRGYPTHWMPLPAPPVVGEDDPLTKPATAFVNEVIRT